MVVSLSGGTTCSRAVQSYPDEQGADRWQCGRNGNNDRVCIPRDFGNGPWHCEKDVCTQRYPDFPSDAEWECYEANNRVLCRTDMAGPVSPEWLCKQDGQRQLCVDANPDFLIGPAHGLATITRPVAHASAGALRPGPNVN